VKIVKFKGGLGNQLFQYSFLKALEIKYKCNDVKADLSFFTDVKNDNVRVPRIEKLNIKINKAVSSDLKNVCLLKQSGNPMSLAYKGRVFAEKTFNSKYYFESDRSYRDPKNLLEYEYFDGYWQSWKYLKGIEEIVRREITLKNDLSEKTEETIKKIKSQNAVFLGIRRGDYLASAKNRKHYGSFGIEYYLQAIDYIKKKVDNPVFYIFSNDIQWVKENMDLNCDVIYRDDEEQTSDVEELFIMAACKHAIIVNSTFYWWGAWLIDNPDKIVIAPNKWFADDKPIDIVPDSWVKI
jgi:hypothetical protein